MQRALFSALLVVGFTTTTVLAGTRSRESSQQSCEVTQEATECCGVEITIDP